MKLLYLFGLLFSCVSTQAQSDLRSNVDDNSLLWEISGNGLQKPSYLFGTFHLMCKEDIRFSASLKQAILKCDEVYLELDLDDPATLLGGIMLMNMKDGKKLKDLYTPEAYNRIANYFKDSLQTPITMFQTMKPELLTVFLFPKMMPCDAVSSVEEAIMALAKVDDKEIKGLETMTFQAALFDSIPYERQASHLLEAIDSMEQSKKSFQLMLDAYKKQQLDKLETIMNDPAYGVEENMNVLVDNRNLNWVSQLKEIMPKRSVFIAVGAGHLPGKKGLISLLRKEGFTVRPLDNRL